MIDSQQLFIIWLSFSILVVLATLPFVIWAIRSGQFSKFDYASRLALRSQIVEEPSPATKAKNAKVDDTDGGKDVSA
jgi:nitrogen fixation-related uncharacterized protein